jgi:hypothetical protein
MVELADFIASCLACGLGLGLVLTLIRAGIEK